MTPPPTSFHRAGSLPFLLIQLSSDLPSKRMMAPSGGGTLGTLTLSSGLASFKSSMLPYGSSAKERPSKRTKVVSMAVGRREKEQEAGSKKPEETRQGDKGTGRHGEVSPLVTLSPCPLVLLPGALLR